MKIENLNHSATPSLNIRNQNVKDVKISTGTVTENQETHSITLKVFKHNGGRYCCIEQDGVDGRFVEVTPKFYDTIDNLEERLLNGWSLDNFKSEF